MRNTILASAFLAAAALLPSAAPAWAADRKVEVVNATSEAMQEFHASNAGRSSWEEDILGTDVLPAGRSVSINIDDGSGACVFDFLAVMDGGRKIEQRGVNVCEVSRFTVR